MSPAIRDRLILFSPIALITALAAAPPLGDGTTICPIASFTGTACPGCGMTRAASQLLHGDLASAVTYHPLLPAVVLVAAGGWVWFVLRRAGRVQPLSNRVLNGVLIGLGVALVGVWIARLLTGSLPPV